MTHFFQSSFGHIAFTDMETGAPPLLLVHGLPTCKELFQPVLPHLNQNFRLIAIDLNDYGESEKLSQFTSKKPGDGMTHKQRADVLDELRQHLELETFVLVAHDLGASVAMDYMDKYGKHVSKLVLMSPPVYPDFKEPPVVKLVRLPYLGEVLTAVLQNTLLHNSILNGLVNKTNYTPELRAAMAKPFADNDGRAALLRNLRWGRPGVFFADYPRIMQEIDTPTLIIHGQQDPYIPLSHAHRLQTDIMDAQLVVIEDGAHFLPIDTPEQVSQAINNFVNQ
jgi:pimeloyl-ACP methyl ester carboxylesterase